MKYVAAVIALLCLPMLASAGVPDDLQDVSVTIKSGNAQGSGNLVTRKIGDDTITFVWTAAHVVDNLRTSRTVVTANGATKTIIEYKDAEIVQERQQDGRRVGEVKYNAKVIKVSDADYGEDLALLMVRCNGAYPLSASTKFHLEEGYIPDIGVELAHCGSLLGQFGANSYTTGVLSQTGRTLPMKGANVKTFDQVTTVSFPGSSGGGMYLKADGTYIGMLTQGVNQLQGFNFIVPVRRMNAWAKSAKIEWAMNPDIEMPTLAEIEAMPVEEAATMIGGVGSNMDPDGFDILSFLF
jgi:S1-C subfamily serine protease